MQYKKVLPDQATCSMIQMSDEGLKFLPIASLLLEPGAHKFLQGKQLVSMEMCHLGN